MLSSENALYEALQKHLEAKIAGAKATMMIYFNRPVGIGGHANHLDEMGTLLGTMAEASDQLKALKKHFSDYKLESY